MAKANQITAFPSRLSILLIRAYRFFLSPWFGNSCRFYPTCSQYSEEAFRVHGFWRGVFLTARRLGKCHPWHPGGLDPVPSPLSATED